MQGDVSLSLRVFLFFVMFTEIIVAAHADEIPIPVGIRPIGIAYNGENGNIYIANANSSTLSVIDTRANSVIATVLVGSFPYAVSSDNMNEYIYVANSGSHDVSVINGAIKKVVKTINMDDQPLSIVFNPVNRYLYVGTRDSNGMGYVTVINGSYLVVNRIPVGKNPLDMTFSSANGAVYVANSGSNYVSVISGTKNEEINRIFVGEQPTGITYSHTSNQIYVANKNSSTLSVIDGTRNIVIQTKKLDAAPIAVAVNPNTNTVYVTHSYSEKNSSLYENLTTIMRDDKADTLKLFNRPDRVAVNSKSDTVYITNPDSNDVTVIDGKTERIIVSEATLPLLAKSIAIVDILALLAIPGIVIGISLSKKKTGYIANLLRHVYLYIKNARFNLLKYISGTWLSSSIVLTIISLIILPLIVVASQIHYEQMILFFRQHSQYAGELEYEKLLIFYLNNIIVQGIFVVMLFFYPPFPAPYPSKEYFRKRGYHTAVFEYDYVKRILYVAVPLFILATIFAPLIQPQIQPLIRDVTSINLNVEMQHPAFRFVQGVIFFVVIAGILKIVFAIVRKRFRLYYAKGCFEIIMARKNSSKIDEVQRMGFVIKGLNSYNAYLRRHLDLNIPSMGAIYSKISKMPRNKKDETINQLCKIFTEENLENDSLTPVRYLYKISIEDETQDKPATAVDQGIEELEEATEEKPISPGEPFLSRLPLFSKIKEWAAFAAVIIPLLIAIIEVYSRLFSR
jgi:YVTN family beta-propeller protein